MAIAKLLFNARKWVAEDARPERGDTTCSIGFRSWEHSRFAVSKAAAKEYAKWLSVADAGSHFVFKLGMMPIRFCRGDSEKPLPPNYRSATEREREAQLSAFTEANVPIVEGVFRFLVSADSNGMPVDILLAHANADGDVQMTWRIPRKEELKRGVTPIVEPQRPVVLPEIELLSHEEVAERARKSAELEARLRQERENPDATERGA